MYILTGLWNRLTPAERKTNRYCTVIVTCKCCSSRYNNHSKSQSVFTYSQLNGLRSHNKISCKPKSSIGQARILEWISRFQNTQLHWAVIKHMLP